MNGELIAELADKIKRRYKATYATDLIIWHQSASAAGEDFKFNIKRALQNTTIFIPLLEAEYLSAPYTRLELSYYQEVRKRKKAKVHIIPLIIWRGRVEEELLDAVGSTVKALYYSRLTTDQAEVELEEREKENIIVDGVVISLRGAEQAEIKSYKFASGFNAYMDGQVLAVAFGKHLETSIYFL